MARDQATTYACRAFYSLFADSLGIPVDAEREAREGCRVERFYEFPSFSSPRETTGIERREGERDGKKESQWRNRSWTKLLSSR